MFPCFISKTFFINFIYKERDGANRAKLNGGPLCVCNIVSYPF